MPTLKISKQDYKVTKGNIHNIYKQASQDEINAGLVWYKLAKDFTMLLESTLDFEISYKKIAGVVAALSVQNQWNTNKKDALNVCMAYFENNNLDDVLVSTYPICKDKAIKILQSDGSNDSIETILGVNARKTKNFYWNIIGDDRAITVDGHAFNIATNRVSSLKEVPSISKKNYKILQTEYKLATTFINKKYNLSLKVSDVQAITWVTYKRINDK